MWNKFEIHTLYKQTRRKTFPNCLIWCVNVKLEIYPISSSLLRTEISTSSRFTSTCNSKNNKKHLSLSDHALANHSCNQQNSCKFILRKKCKFIQLKHYEMNKELFIANEKSQIDTTKPFPSSDLKKKIQDIYRAQQSSLQEKSLWLHFRKKIFKSQINSHVN